MSKKALLVELKRFAVHDGPGIRTTLFLKGCPLSCWWCHNPESISGSPQLAHYEHKCINCASCVEICPNNAHEIENEHVFKREKCKGCGLCEDECLGNALKFFGREISVDEAFELAIEDLDFYENDGGVTISGGEPLLHSDFCTKLLIRLRNENINCAIDTSGAVPWKSFEKVIPYTQIFLYDFKHIDDDSHRKHVGASNKLILENLKALSKCNVPIEVRIPIIPDFNDNEDVIRKMADFLAPLKNIQKVKLLAYHEFAKSKYNAIGIKNKMPEVQAPSQDEIKILEAIFLKTPNTRN